MGKNIRKAIAFISVNGDPAAEIGEEETGGQSVYLSQISRILATLGWQVDMFTRKANPNSPRIVSHSPFCRTIRLNAGPEHYISRDEIFEYMPQFLQAFEGFQVENAIRYPLVHTHYWLSGWIGLQLKKRSIATSIVHTYHSLAEVKYQSVSSQPKVASTRLTTEQQILEQLDVIVATSPQEREDLRYLLSSKGCVIVIPCGVDIHNFHVIPKAQARLRLGLDINDQIVLYVGRFDFRKGIETMVRACAQSIAHSKGKLQVIIVAGSNPNRIDGIERNRIEQIVQEVGLAEKVTFPGQISHDLMPLFYSSADVCTIPSHYEPFGLVALEAMACGTPVVASDTGGLKFTIVPEQTGLLVPPKDTTAFTKAIDSILENESWARSMGEQGVKRVCEKFSWEKVTNELNSLYRSLIP
ncbi:MAG: glycosyltransferase [Nostoc sp. NMS1]|uniref:glycosyltransferase n=1 Tax=unclassified Nostoc TaxID=2593658 RepID=UPI0025D29A93|nr:glycosyltransferase [Nostoc sp. NMS1]MBN3908324.1 glycosyltransferase [Nostoc sp. NMS1]